MADKPNPHRHPKHSPGWEHPFIWEDADVKWDDAEPSADDKKPADGEGEPED